jgi:PHD/YefM family antitoxin component YafN of YafNO toxin-antitoxin module
MQKPTQFLTNEKGEKVAVVIPIKEYEQLLEELEELDDIRAYDEAKASGEVAVPLEQVLDRIERERNRQ